MRYLKADAFYLPHQIKYDGYLEINQGRFGDWCYQLPQGADVIDYSGYSIAPGLFDTHIHGYAGYDVMDNSRQGLEAMSQALLATGVTSFLPTTLTAPFEQILAVCQTLGESVKKVKGAKIQGIYLEGPYFSSLFKGAQNDTYLKSPSLAEFWQWQEAANGHIKKVALAPEKAGSLPFIQTLKDAGIILALGHSNASYQEAQAAVSAGASVWVHAYNGMRGFNHREPGILGAVLTSPKTYAELICDGQHVSPVASEILLRQKGSDQTVFITDCMRAGGLVDGDYYLGEYAVSVSKGAARLKTSGQLAGSVLTLLDAVKNSVDWGIASPHEAIKMASYTAAKSMRLENQCGQLKKGLAADFLVLDDKLNLLATYLDGKKCHQAKALS